VVAQCCASVVQPLALLVFLRSLLELLLLATVQGGSAVLVCSILVTRSVAQHPGLFLGLVTATDDTDV
jgi:hypothetical protein